MSRGPGRTAHAGMVLKVVFVTLYRTGNRDVVAKEKIEHGVMEKRSSIAKEEVCQGFGWTVGLASPLSNNGSSHDA